MGSRHLHLVKGQENPIRPQLDLFNETPDLEDRIRRQPILKAIESARVFNDAPYYGSTEDNMKVFLQKTMLSDKKTLIDSKTNGVALEKALEGMNNFESFNGQYGVAHSILIRMNTPEILALYIGIQQAKSYAYFPSTANKFSELISLGGKNFGDMISKLVGIGYEYDGIKKMARLRRGFWRHSTSPGALIKRMYDVPKEDQAKFIKSLLTPYRKFGEYTDEFKYEFKDPFGRDEQRHDYSGKKAWINRIADFMKQVYISNMVYLQLNKKPAK
ncbi:hypothetical protein HYT53_00725 [Candidatus Woesearchaeota archaeon]|nr:hypothetical protein [Candidatus Woesearchaeota archaeon]